MVGKVEELRGNVGRYMERYMCAGSKCASSRDKNLVEAV